MNIKMIEEIIKRYADKLSKQRIKKDCKDLYIYALNPKYSDFARYKYPKDPDVQHSEMEDFFLPMYYKNDKKIIRIRELKPNKCYWIFMKGMWSPYQIDSTRWTLYK